MSVEGGRIGVAMSTGSAISVSPVITASREGGAASVSGLTGSFRGPAFEAAPALASLGRFGVELIPSLSINEGPAAKPFVEESMPLSKGEIKFNSLIGPSVSVAPVAPEVGGEFKSVEFLQLTKPLVVNPNLELNQTQVVKEAETIIAEAQKPAQSTLSELEIVKLAEEWLKVTRPKVEPATVSVVEAVKTAVIVPKAEPLVAPPAIPRVGPEVIPITKNSASPKIQLVVSPALEAQTDTKTGTENGTSSLVVPTTNPQIESAEEKVEEAIEQAAQAEEELGQEETEDTEVARTKIVESIKTSEERRKVIDVAVDVATIFGITIKKALSKRFWELVSPLVKKRRGKDWTIDLTADELNINPTKFGSVEQAKEVAIETVAHNIPAEEGEGRQLTVGQVRKITHGEDDKLKPKIPAEIVRRRVVRKKMVVSRIGQKWTVVENEQVLSFGNKTETTQENTLRDLSLEEVFQKAAA